MVHTGRFFVPEEEEEGGEPELKLLVPTHTRGTISIFIHLCHLRSICIILGNITGSDGSTVFWTKSTFPCNASPVTLVCIRGTVDEHMESKLAADLPELWTNALLVRAFYRPSASLGTFSAVFLRVRCVDDGGLRRISGLYAEVQPPAHDDHSLSVHRGWYTR